KRKNSMITRRDFLKVSGAAAAAAALAACGSSEGGAASGKPTKFTVAVPNDTTNEARALQLLEKNGFFTLKEGSGITATKNDIAENPLNITIDEVEAAQVPNVLQDERSEEHTSELSHVSISYAVFCLKKKN